MNYQTDNKELCLMYVLKNAIRVGFHLFFYGN